MNFEKYPFEKLNELLAKIEPNKEFEPVVLTIGEPQFETPLFIQDELKRSSNLLNKYPKTAGEKYLKNAQLKFFKRRFGIELNNDELIPTFGTREVLFNFPQFLLFDTKNPVIAYTNPFYQIYEGAAKMCGAKVLHLNLTKQNDFKPDINDKRLKDANLVIINFPNNPTASTLSLDELKEWVRLALKYDFVLLNDECYSELYSDKKPASLLEASLSAGNETFKNILIINSISKRSSSPGLRSGFIAGDKNILKKSSCCLQEINEREVTCIEISEKIINEVPEIDAAYILDAGGKQISKMITVKEKYKKMYIALKSCNKINNLNDEDNNVLFESKDINEVIKILLKGIK